MTPGRLLLLAAVVAVWLLWRARRRIWFRAVGRFGWRWRDGEDLDDEEGGRRRSPLPDWKRRAVWLYYGRRCVACYAEGIDQGLPYRIGRWNWRRFVAVVTGRRRRWNDSRLRYECDHVVPHSWGGSDRLSNLQPLCRFHNRSKRNYHAGDWRHVVRRVRWWPFRPAFVDRDAAVRDRHLHREAVRS